MPVRPQALPVGELAELWRAARAALERPPAWSWASGPTPAG